MADKEVKIDFKTKADTRGAKKVEKAVDEVGKASIEQGQKSQDSAKKTEKSLNFAEMAARNLRESLENADGLSPTLKKKTEDLAKSMDRLVATGTKVSKAQLKGQKSTRRTAAGFLEVSRAVEDAQYGLSGVLNNIPNIIQMFGGSAGLAGAISITAVALTQLGPLLVDTGERSKKTAKLAEELATSIKRVGDASRTAAGELFVDQVDRLSEALTIQNKELQANRNLLMEKRKAELEIAALQDNLELAQIAARAATDPTFTAADQLSAKLAVEQRQIEREKQDRILKSQTKIEAELDKRAKLEAEQNFYIEQLNESVAITAVKRKREAELLLKQSQAQDAIKDADANREKIFAKFLPKGNKFDAAAERQEKFAEKRFGSDERKELEAINRDLKSFERFNEDIRVKLNEISASLVENQIDVESVRTLTDAQQETAISAASLKEEILRNKELEQAAKISITESTSVIKNSVLPELEKELLTRGELDIATKREVDNIRRISSNNEADLQEKEQLLISLRVLQAKGIDVTGRLVTMSEQSLAKQNLLERRVRILEEKLKP